jgi:hypothetical protein
LLFIRFLFFFRKADLLKLLGNPIDVLLHRGYISHFSFKCTHILNFFHWLNFFFYWLHYLWNLCWYDEGLHNYWNLLLFTAMGFIN